MSRPGPGTPGGRAGARRLVVGDAVRRGAARVAAAARRVPRRVWAVLLGLLLVGGGFAAVVAPLLLTARRGHPTAEVAGRLPDRARLDRPLDVVVAVDNTGTTVIHPLCLEVVAEGAVELGTARFQGLDTVPFHQGRACGGELSGQETVSVVLVVVPRAPGPLRLSIAPAEDGTVIGAPLRGTVLVTP